MPLSTELPAQITLKVGARGSALSQVQVQEVLQELRVFLPSTQLNFETQLLSTPGDIDLKTSLRLMDKSDFFTHTIDRAVLEGIVDIGIHSAKDLPDPLPEGLEMIALTKGQDPRDSLLLPPNKKLEDLGPSDRVACSSLQREKALKALNPHICFVEVRGGVDSRVAQWQRGDFEALVVAEAALVRLDMTHLHRQILSYTPTPFQGQLAVLAKKDQSMLKFLFSMIDVR